MLAAHVLHRPRTWVLGHPEYELTGEHQRILAAAAGRLEAGEPLPYVLGHWEFYGLDLLVTPAVLIPRPETELLVETALAWLRAHADKRRAVDVGTGSGCIAVALAVNVPDLKFIATDRSIAALRVARANSQRHGVEGRVRLAQGDLLSWVRGQGLGVGSQRPKDGLPPGSGPKRGCQQPAFSANTPGENDFHPAAANQKSAIINLQPPAPFDLIAANLPYIPDSKLKGLAVAQREPQMALAGGADGLYLVGRLLRQAPDRLAPGGLALLEIEASQGSAALALAQAAFPSARVQVLADLAGRDRLLVIQS